MNDLDSEPPPVTPVSPNKRKFSFRFPSAGHHHDDTKTERRNFSDEAQSISDLQVCNNRSSEKSQIKIYYSLTDLTKITNECDYVDMTGQIFNNHENILPNYSYLHERFKKNTELSRHKSEANLRFIKKKRSRNDSLPSYFHYSENVKSKFYIVECNDSILF